jgi:hypothetical protein
LVESHELATYRRYYAACLQELRAAESSQADSPTRLTLNPEVTIAARLQEITRGTLGALWSTFDLQSPLLVAASNWLLDWLWFDVAGMHFIHRQAQAPAFGLSETNLVAAVFAINPASRQEKVQRQHGYISWILQRFGSRAERRVDMARHLKRLLLSVSKGRGSVDQTELGKLATAIFVTGILRLFPPAFIDTIGFTREEAERLGVRVYDPAIIGGAVFDGAEFWPAAAASRGT